MDRIDVLDVLRPERELLCELLASLGPGEWACATECPAWTVKGVALHVLGDDLSLLSRQRDGETPSLVTEPALPPWEGAPATILDRFNERWVHASTYLSPALLIELLRSTGEWTHAWYASADPDERGEAVLLFGEQAAPYWAIAAREYLERWVHHLQLRRAVGLGNGRLDEPPLRPRAYDAIALALRALLAFAAPPADARIVLVLGDDAWTFTHDATVAAHAGWTVARGRIGEPTATLSVDATIATTLASRGLSARDVEAAVVATGDAGVGSALVAGMASAFSGYYPDVPLPDKTDS